MRRFWAPLARAIFQTRVSKLWETLFTMGGQIAYNRHTKRSRGVMDMPLPEPVGPVKLFMVADRRTS